MEKIKIETKDSKEVICVNFEHNNKKGYFEYRLFGYDDDCGIDNCQYEEEANEDIYSIIHDWINKHIETRRIITFDGIEI